MEVRIDAVSVAPRQNILALMAALAIAAGDLVEAESALLELMAWCAFCERATGSWSTSS